MIQANNTIAEIFVLYMNFC